MESRLHRKARFRRLHPSQKRIEFFAQRIEFRLPRTRERVEFVHRNQDCFWRVVLRNDHCAALSHHFKNAAKLILRVGRRERGRFELLTSTVPEPRDRFPS